MPTDRERFRLACEADPGDLVRYAVYADFLRESGAADAVEVLIAGLDWCAATGKRPHHCPDGYEVRVPDGRGGWHNERPVGPGEWVWLCGTTRAAYQRFAGPEDSLREQTLNQVWAAIAKACPACELPAA